jgi:zinc protease
MRPIMTRILCALFMLIAMPLRAEIAIQEVTSPGGIKAWLVEDHTNPFMSLEIRFRGGTALDDPAKRGAINLMTGLIEEGAGDLDAQGFANARDGLAASLEFRPYGDAISVSMRALTENRDQVADLLNLALTQPRFDQDAVDRVRGQVLTGLAADAKDPGTIAAQRFDADAFGSHPYATSGDGTVESVTALTREDVVAGWKAALAQDRVYVAAVGDISPAELGALIDKVLAGLPATGPALPGRADYALKGGVTVVDYPSPQSVIQFGHQGIRRDDPDFFAAYLLNEILGGGRFGSRLMTEVREKRGLTYGVGTALVPMDHAELYLGSLSTENSKVGQVIDLLRSEWARLAKDGVTEAELADAKTYLTGSYPLRFDSNAAIANILVGMQMEDLPIDYASTRNAKIEAVTLADMARVAARILRPDDLHFVVVGQPEGLN